MHFQRLIKNTKVVCKLWKTHIVLDPTSSKSRLTQDFKGTSIRLGPYMHLLKDTMSRKDDTY